MTALVMGHCSPAKTPADRLGASGIDSTAYQLQFPLGLSADSAYIPPENPLTLEKVKLGKRLYFEKRLSLDETISCASCHMPEKGFSDDESLSTGVGGKRGTRHAPTIINRLFSGAQFWDGRAASLEVQAMMPVQNPLEMGMPDIEQALQRLREDPIYAGEFRAAFPPDGDVSAENVSAAIASFERTILSGNSPYDRFMAGDKKALSESARRGLKIFNDENKGNCQTCHVGANFSDENYNNIGIGMTSGEADMGRYAISKLEGHQGAFKTPTLRDVAGRGPYMHDGSQTTLKEVVAFYIQGGHANRWLSPKIRALKLTQQEQQDLVEFLEALSGEVTWYGKGEE